MSQLLVVAAIVLAFVVLLAGPVVAAFRRLVASDPYDGPLDDLPPLSPREVRNLRNRYGLDEWSARD